MVPLLLVLICAHAKIQTLYDAVRDRALPLPPEAKNAVWGGLMTAGAKARGAIGVVISGRCRDLAEHRNAGFPVFARGH